MIGVDPQKMASNLPDGSRYTGLTVAFTPWEDV
jgi:hypothetical protein